MSDNIPNDPFADRESKNYENPIPSREFIIEFLEQAGVPMNRNDLFEALKLEGEEQYEGLRRRLRAMERDGQLVFTRRQCYALPEKLEMLIKGLPKSIRRGLFPIKEYAEVLSESLEHDEDFYQQLVKTVFKKNGLQTTTEDWQATQLDDHLRFRFVVYDNNNKTLKVNTRTR